MHCGEKKTRAECKKRFYYYGLQDIISQVIKKCECCSQVKSDYFGPTELKVITSSRPMERIQGDYIFLPKTQNGYKAICMFTDHFTKYAWVLPCKEKSAANTVALLKDIVEANIAIGVPADKIFKLVQTDNGAELKNSEVEEYVKQYGGSLIHGRPYHPQSQGGQEKAGGTLKTLIASSLIAHGANWVAHLNRAMEVYRNTLHSTLKDSPQTVWIETWVKFYKQGEESQRKEWVAAAVSKMKEINEKQKQAGVRNQERHKKRFVGKKKKLLQVGTIVMVKAQRRKKTEPRFLYKAIITKVIEQNMTYELEWKEDAWRGQHQGKKATRLFNYSELKPIEQTVIEPLAQPQNNSPNEQNVSNNSEIQITSMFNCITHK